MSPSDCNNNPSPSQSETFFEQTDPFVASCCSDIKLSAGRAKFPHQENSKQGGMMKQKHNSSRHSLPANFEQYQTSSCTPDSSRPVSVHVMNNHSQPRPLSVFSDRPSLYPNSFQFAEGSSQQCKTKVLKLVLGAVQPWRQVSTHLTVYTNIPLQRMMMLSSNKERGLFSSRNVSKIISVLCKGNF